MARHADRHATGPNSALSPLLTGTLALVALAAVAGEAAAQAGAAIDHWRQRPPVDPLALVLELADGRTRWPPAGTPILIAAAAACAVLAAVVVACSREKAPGGRRGSGGAAARYRPQRASDLAAQRAGDGQAVRCRAARTADRTGRRGRSDAVRDVGGHAVRHLGPAQRQEHGARDPDAAGRARRRVRDLQQARPVRGHPGGPRAGAAGCGTSTPSRSPPARLTGGGTRSATSPLTAARWS